MNININYIHNENIDIYADLKLLLYLPMKYCKEII